MHLTNKLFLVALTSLCFSCGSDKAPKVNGVKTKQELVLKNTDVAANPTTQVHACGERVKDFLRWYLDLVDIEKQHPEGSSVSFKLPITAETDSAVAARVRPENRSSNKYFQMNWPSVDSYLATLEKSGYFSKSYLREKRVSLIRRGKAPDAMKIEDGEPEGFEADEVFWMMELYEPSDINGLRVYQKLNTKIGSSVYELPQTLPEGEKFSFLIYSKNENGRCVVDSVARLSNGKYSSVGNK